MISGVFNFFCTNSTLLIRCYLTQKYKISYRCIFTQYGSIVKKKKKLFFRCILSKLLKINLIALKNSYFILPITMSNIFVDKKLHSVGQADDFGEFLGTKITPKPTCCLSSSTIYEKFFMVTKFSNNAPNMRKKKENFLTFSNFISQKAKKNLDLS